MKLKDFLLHYVLFFVLYYAFLYGLYRLAAGSYADPGRAGVARWMADHNTAEGSVGLIRQPGHTGHLPI